MASAFWQKTNHHLEALVSYKYLVGSKIVKGESYRLPSAAVAGGQQDTFPAFIAEH